MTVLRMPSGMCFKFVMVSVSVCGSLVLENRRCHRRADRMRAELASAEHEQRKNQYKLAGGGKHGSVDLVVFLD